MKSSFKRVLCLGPTIALSVFFAGCQSTVTTIATPGQTVENNQVINSLSIHLHPILWHKDSIVVVGTLSGSEENPDFLGLEGREGLPDNDAILTVRVFDKENSLLETYQHDIRKDDLSISGIGGGPGSGTRNGPGGLIWKTHLWHYLNHEITKIGSVEVQYGNATYSFKDFGTDNL